MGDHGLAVVESENEEFAHTVHGGHPSSLETDHDFLGRSVEAGRPHVADGHPLEHSIQHDGLEMSPGDFDFG
jgi:hypothetical protein